MKKANKLSYAALREATGLTHIQVARLTGFAPSEISSWEAGNRKPCKKDAARLVGVLKESERRFDHPALRGQRHVR